MKYFDYPIADCHVHLFPDHYFDKIWDYFSNYNWDVRYRLYSDDAVKFLVDAGIEQIWFSNYAHRTDVARELIDYSLALLDRYPQLRYYSAIHPDDPDYLDYVDEILAHPQVLGFKLQLLVQCFHADYAPMLPVYEKVMEAGKAILFHIGTGPVGNEFVGLHNFKRIIEIFPELKCQIAHLGAYEVDEFFELAGRYPNIWFDSSFCFVEAPNYEAPLKKDNIARLLTELSDRIVYGSDFPDIPFEHSQEPENLKKLALDPNDLRKIMRDNARRIERDLLGK
jgi:uncharacterized protein